MESLLAAELFTTDQIYQTGHRASMEMKGDNTDISFLPVAPDIIRVQSEQVTSSNITPPTSCDKSAFGPRPNTQAADFDFEINCQPFKLILRKDAEMTCPHQSQFINIINDHPEVFSLHNEDLRFCDKIKHTILTTSDKPVYLLHHTIHHQL